jgi:RNA polymerase sigma factor (TIGR02999 family)
MSEVSQILSTIGHGDPSAAGKLLPVVYDELRRLAAAKLAQEKPGQTLQATALVHEAFIRLVDVEQRQKWNSRGHFFAAAAEAMRRILVENARRKRSLKRGGDLKRRELLTNEIVAPEIKHDVLILNEALDRLDEVDQQAATLVKLRYFTGLYVFWRSPNFETNDASTRPTIFRKHWGTKWPALYVGLIALMLASLALEADSGVISRTWFNFTGQGRITLKVHDAEVRVTLNGAPRAVSENGQVHVVVAAGVYVIRSSRAIYVHEIQPGFRITQKIHHAATEVAIIGPVSTDKLDQGARIELLEKYSQ